MPRLTDRDRAQDPTAHDREIETLAEFDRRRRTRLAGLRTWRACACVDRTSVCERAAARLAAAAGHRVRGR